MAGSSARRRIARGPMDSVVAPASSPASNGGSARPKRPRRLNPSCSAQLRPYVLRSKDVLSMLSAVIGLPGEHHHVFAGWLRRANRDDSVTMLTTSRGLGTGRPS
eukprot:1366015-Prymnesium_polylepis.1